MSKKKSKSEDKKLKKSLIELIKFIVSLPYILVKSIFKLVKQLKQKKQNKKIEKTRSSIDSIYVPFQQILDFEGDYASWEQNLFDSESMIGIIIGARGKGKTALGIKLMENMYAKTKKKICAMGFKDKDLPSWINVIEEVNEVKNNSFVLIDEGGILFSSRDSMSKPNKVLSDLILIARHKNLSIIFISQNSSNLEINILRQADCLLLKPSSLLQKDFERKKIQKVYEEVKDEFEKLKKYKGLTYIYSEDYRGFVNNDLPSFWSQKISKSFASNK
ncbi:hypothetical protein HN789_07265 [archaeon]|jgi:hypothetical protein|nr:hypothetical protein [archaeon]MBT4021779.1 hypothetical protein [archaeon]MBT4271806.1 hypothetical protein [archaeon]MBT4460499.1 hypothetical protein [archaeon]MBT4858519.1 hypothetical protein [archaeon]